MTGKDIFLGLKYVGEDLIAEAETARFPVQANQKNTHRKIRRPLLSRRSSPQCCSWWAARWCMC